MRAHHLAIVVVRLARSERTRANERAHEQASGGAGGAGGARARRGEGGGGAKCETHSARRGPECSRRGRPSSHLGWSRDPNRARRARRPRRTFASTPLTTDETARAPLRPLPRGTRRTACSNQEGPPKHTRLVEVSVHVGVAVERRGARELRESVDLFSQVLEGGDESRPRTRVRARRETQPSDETDAQTTNRRTTEPGSSQNSVVTVRSTQLVLRCKCTRAGARRPSANCARATSAAAVPSNPPPRRRATARDVYRATRALARNQPHRLFASSSRRRPRGARARARALSRRRLGDRSRPAGGVPAAAPASRAIRRSATPPPRTTDNERALRSGVPNERWLTTCERLVIAALRLWWIERASRWKLPGTRFTST